LYLNKNINTPLLLFFYSYTSYPSISLSTSYECNYSSTGSRFFQFIIIIILIIVIVIHQNYFYYKHDYNTIDIHSMTWEVYAIILNSYVQKRITWWINHKLIFRKFMHSTKVELKISVWCLIANLNLFSMCFRLDALVMHKKVMSWGEFLLHSSRCEHFFLLKNISLFVLNLKIWYE